MLGISRTAQDHRLAEDRLSVCWVARGSPRVPKGGPPVLGIDEKLETLRGMEIFSGQRSLLP